MNIHATLSSLLLALLTALNPHAVAAACVEDSAEVVVRVYRFSEGPPAYAFMVINNADTPIRTLSIGRTPFLPITGENIPTSVGSPTGWEGNYFFSDNHPSEYMQYLWQNRDSERTIPPGASLSGFSVQLSYPISTEQRRLFDPRGRPVIQADLRDVPFEVLLTGGICHTGFMSVD